MNQNKKLPNLVSILVLTLITVVMWIAFNVYRAILTTTGPSASSVSDEVSSPFTPSLDKDTIDEIESKIFLDESQIPNTTFSPEATPLPPATQTVIATPEASITPTQSTPSGSQPL